FSGRSNPVSLRNLQATPDQNSPRHTNTQLCGISLNSFAALWKTALGGHVIPGKVKDPGN
ncbi:MAG: hypothetical protein ABS888_05350, partial [Eubacteriales bacterium]